MNNNRVSVLGNHLKKGSVQSVGAALTTNATGSGWVIQMVETVDEVEPGSVSLKGKTIFITGASRGIGLAIGKRCAREGANIVIAAKTTETQEALEGTIFSAAKEIEDLGGKALAVKCDVRDEKDVQNAVQAAVKRFGGIDILVNNASAISLTDTLNTDMKKYDLMHSVDGRATFLVSKTCLPYLLESAKKGRNPHVLAISPPLGSITQDRWFKNNVAYSMAKFNMTLCMMGMAAEFKSEGIAFNTLWPRTAIATAAVKNLLGGDHVMNTSRTVESMSDAAYCILSSSSKKCTGKFLVDDVVLLSLGIGLGEVEKKYHVVKGTKSHDLAADFFV